MQLSDLFDVNDLNKAIEEGMVTKRSHPTLPLFIYNYTDKVQYGWNFDKVTLQCRGLVADDKGRIVARPFDKFFTADQPGHAEIDLDEPVIVTDKADGSLIIYTNDREYGPIVSSRGSFESAQAKVAEEILLEVFDNPGPPHGVTYLFELVGPGNRIVLEYEKDELIMLGGRLIETGHHLGQVQAAGLMHWAGRQVEEFTYSTIRELLLAPDRAGAEGYVISTHDGRMLKHKFDAYVELHRVIFGMNEKSIWRMMSEGKTLEEMIDGLPDEIHSFVKLTYGDLSYAAKWIRDAAERAFQLAPAGVDRKTFAEYAKTTKYPALVFAMLDGKDTFPMIMRMIEPKLER